MKAHFENEDIEAIAEIVVNKLKAVIFKKEVCNNEDVIFTVKSLAEYLKVDASWIYKQVSLKTIPYFKSGKYTRFKKSSIDNWIKSQTIRPVLSIKEIKTSVGM